MAVEEARAGVAVERKPQRLLGVVTGLTFVKVMTAAAGFVTGPLTARALGASGRGDLAAVLVPLGLLPPVLGFGISGYAFRSLPSGKAPEEVIGSLGLPLIAIGLVGMAVSVPLADLLAGGRPVVRTYLIVVVLTLPLQLLGGLLYSCLAALQRWRAVALVMLIPFAAGLGGIVVLYAVGGLSVGSAAAVQIAGSVLTVLPALPWLSGLRRPVFRFTLARKAISFGLKSWAGGLALLANARLDQFLMITAVAPRQLGLYAVATTVSGAPTVVSGALAYPLMARVGGGESALVARGVRMVLVVTVAINAGVAVATPPVLSLLFGPEFNGAISMTLVLLVAAVPFCGAMVLSGGLQADGAPLIPSMGEGIAVVITIVGLAVLLGPLGGMGAAIVSVAAYSTSFLFQLFMASRRTGMPIREFLLPTVADARWLRGQIPHMPRLRPAA